MACEGVAARDKEFRLDRRNFINVCAHANVIHNVKFWHRELNWPQSFVGSLSKMTYSELGERSKHSWQIVGCERSLKNMRILDFLCKIQKCTM